jgi:hypothetical protein
MLVAGCWLLDEKQNIVEVFFLIFMSIQYLVPLGRDIQYPLLKLYN